MIGMAQGGAYAPVEPRVSRATATFAGATPNALGDHDGTGDGAAVFTVTGSVVVQVFAYCTTNLGFTANATIELGIAGSTASVIAQTDLTVAALIAQEIWHDATPDAEIELSSVAKEVIITDGNDIIITVGTANVNSGVIAFVATWYPLSTDGLITGNDAS